MHGYIIQGDMGNVAEVGIEHGTIAYNGRSYTITPWSHILIKLFLEVDHILKKYWLRISNNISFNFSIT
jgi:hypothetical protein